MSNAPQIIDGTAVLLSSTTEPLPPVSAGRRRKLVLALSRTMGQIERASQAASDAKVVWRQMRQAVDPREVAGGFVGLTAGEVIGGAVGGAAGAAVAGPPGAIVGAEVGAFTAGMLGLKLGMDAVQDLKESSVAHPPAGADQAATPDADLAGRTLSHKMQARSSEIVGLTSGATIGLVMAGPAGGMVGAVVGETLGARLKAGLIRPAAGQPANWPLPNGGENVSQWLNRFGKNTAGEAATILMAGSVGSVFGLSGLTVGQRIGRVVSKRIEWDQLAQPITAETPSAVDTPTEP